MISAADFPDLFPSATEQERRRGLHQTAEAEYDACIARWEDDGGLTFRPIDRASPSHDFTHADEGHHVPSQTDALRDVVPALTVFWGTVAILSLFAQNDARQSWR